MRGIAITYLLNEFVYAKAEAEAEIAEKSSISNIFHALFVAYQAEKIEIHLLCAVVILNDQSTSVLYSYKMQFEHSSETLIILLQMQHRIHEILKYQITD